MTFYHNRSCASPIPPFRESLPARLSFLPDETRLGLHAVAAQGCRIICRQVRSDKAGLAQSPEVPGWSGSLQGQHVPPAFLEHCRAGKQLGQGLVFQICFSYGSVQSVPPPLRELGRRRAAHLEDEGKSPEIVCISASLSLMML